nr:PREDICTED: vicilin-like seed storage protein At2g18540 [Bemisia tabaci]XP_018917244.1 PREDICTED: vicilin-like seed storage protein At2g18540 [Bemisia tabaci]
MPAKSIYHSPLGPILLEADDKGLTRLVFQQSSKRSGHNGEREDGEPKREENKFLVEAKREEEKLLMEAKREEEKFLMEAKGEEEKFRMEAKREEEKFRMEAKREEEKFRMEAKREEEKFRMEAKREEEKFRMEAKREEEKFRMEAKREEEEFRMEAKREEEKFRMEAKREENKFLTEAKRELSEYFAGERRVFEVPLHVPRGTEFQRRVWRALRTMPYGRTCSYQELAERVESPRAVRAVAQANKANPIAVIVPCHRVIGKSGKLTGYMGAAAEGLALKKALLELEHGARTSEK